MARSFFTGSNDADLYTGSNAFSAQISATPTAFFLVAAQATAYAALDADFSQKWLAANNEETRTKAAIVAKDEAARVLRAAAADLASIIDGNPVSDAQKTALGLNVRKTSEPMGAPGTPYAFKVKLMGDGSIDLSFKCNNPTGSQGTMYQMFRRLGAVGAFEYLGGVGEKKYHDTTIPAGTASVTYKIQAVRSTAVGDWAEFNVGFGFALTGELSASVTEAKPGTIAA